jgi:hypothetical protein
VGSVTAGWFHKSIKDYILRGQERSIIGAGADNGYNGYNGDYVGWSEISSLNAGTAVAQYGDALVAADAGDPLKMPCIGFYAGSATNLVKSSGSVDGLSGLVVDALYYVAVGGGLTTVEPSDPGEVAAFRREHRDIIVKPLFGNGGAGVFHIRPDDENLNALLEMFTQRSREPVIVQRYLPEVRSGDKRIILIDGEIGGGLLRIPAAGEARANLHVGGKAVKTALTRREHEICERLGPELRARGLVFVGIDVIGDYLTEINVTSPTGIQEIGRYDGVDLAGRIWDAIERRVAEGRARR